MSDVMLLGVLRMPVPYPVDAMWLHQFVDRARQAADRIEADGAEIQRLRIALARAVPAMHSYASKNPTHIMNDALQDPCGVHAWLADFGA